MHATRRSWIIAAAALGALVAAPPALAADRLPDLGMGRITDLKIDKSTITHHRLLRYSALIVNVGQGAFELNGSRPDTATSTMTMSQRIYGDTGGFRDVSVPATAFYSGDGHNHWGTWRTGRSRGWTTATRSARWPSTASASSTPPPTG